MNNYTLSSLIAFVLIGMGIFSLTWGLSVWLEAKQSKSARKMLALCLCVFFWNYGYAWMSMCHGDDFWALTARAIALLAVYLYMIFVINYVVYLSKFPRRIYLIFVSVCVVLFLASWSQVIKPSAVSFVEVPWGYWYTSHFSLARIFQFASIMAALVFYYIVLNYWKKNTENKRSQFIIRKFYWFGPILFSGYILDTVVPSLFNTAAIPGSSVGAFFSAALLFKISKDNKAFDITISNVSDYVFRDVNTPVLIFNDKGFPALINKECEDFFGMNKELILSKEMSDLFIPSSTFDGLYEIPDKNVYYKIDTSDIYDNFDEILYVIVFITDMTHEQNTMKELSESRIAAEAANQAKSNFLANMSHEIRTPMNAIIGMSDILLLDNSMSDELRSGIAEIKTAGTNLISIINDILNISKIESGKLELISDSYNLPSVLQDICSIIVLQVHKKDIAFTTITDPTLPANLIGDSVKIRELLINIIGNAIKFTNEGSITLSVSWNKDTSDPLLSFAVTDTGIGIKSEDLDTIFGTFNQVDTRKNRNVEGTGLGLAISKRIAMLMGGDIIVESTYGKGSTFTIKIKQSLGKYVPIGDKITFDLSRSNFHSETRNETINYSDKSMYKVLIVDDNKVNLRVAAGVMKPYKLQITTALSGYDALNLVKEHDYDLIFMDHMMPEMDGVDTTKRIRELDDGKYKDIPVIALTANTISESKEYLLNNGMQDFLAKPIDRKALDEIINKWLK